MLHNPNSNSMKNNLLKSNQNKANNLPQDQMSQNLKSNPRCIMVKCFHYSYEKLQVLLYCLCVDAKNKNITKQKTQRNLFYDLPASIVSKIYEYDDTYKKKFDKVLHELIYYDSVDFMDVIGGLLRRGRQTKLGAIWNLSLAYDGLIAIYDYDIIKEEEFLKLHHILLKKLKQKLYIEYLEYSYGIGDKGVYCECCKGICYNN